LRDGSYSLVTRGPIPSAPEQAARSMVQEVPIKRHALSPVLSLSAAHQTLCQCSSIGNRQSTVLVTWERERRPLLPCVFLRLGYGAPLLDCTDSAAAAQSNADGDGDEARGCVIQGLGIHGATEDGVISALNEGSEITQIEIEP